MTWVDLSAAFGYGTKLTSTQMQNLRDNLAAMAAGDSGAPEIVEAALGDSAVAQAKLKTATHDQSTLSTNWVAKTLTYAEYGFACLVKGGGAGSHGHLKRSDDTDFTNIEGETYTGETVYLKTSSGSYYAYVEYKYVTASGEVFWLWLLRDKATKQIISADAASDHCSFGQDDPMKRPHPFRLEYDPEKHDIVLINPDKQALKAMYDRAEGRNILQTFLEDYGIDDAIETQWPDTPVTVKIHNADWFERYIQQQSVKIEKKIIPKVDYVLCRGMKLKTEKAL